MKKLFICLCTTILALSLVACSSSNLTDTDTVSVKIDQIFFEGSDQNQILKDADEMGIDKCVINNDGSVTYTLSKVLHAKLLENYKTNAILVLREFVSGEEKVPSFEDVDFSDNFADIKITVNETYTAMDSMIAMPIMIMGAYYQNFDGVDFKDIDVHVSFIDANRNVLDSLSFKEILEIE